MTDEQLTKWLNGSGFPLQMGIKHFVEHGGSPWQVRYEEHGWKNERDGTEGFIDLVLSRPFYDELRAVMVVECKRPQNSKLIFPVTNSAQMDRSHCKIWFTHALEKQVFGWSDLGTVDPRTPEAAFCIVGGEKDKRAMLERASATLISSTEALAHEEQALVHATKSASSLFIYFSVFVTTAELYVSDFAPSSVRLEDGMVDTAHFRQVPYLRFRKQLSTSSENAQKIETSQLSNRQIANLKLDGGAKENTVFVVNAASFPGFLHSFDVNVEYSDLPNRLHP